MNKLKILFLLLLLLPLAVACSDETEPIISLEVVVSELTAEEFEHVGTNDLVNPSQNDFRKLTCTLEIENSKNITRTIEFPSVKDWTDALKTLDGPERYRFGSSYKQDNPDEDFARYGHEFVFYSKGLSEEAIRNSFNEIVIEVDLNTTQDYKISDVIQFEK